MFDVLASEMTAIADQRIGLQIEESIQIVVHKNGLIASPDLSKMKYWSEGDAFSLSFYDATATINPLATSRCYVN